MQGIAALMQAARTAASQGQHEKAVRVLSAFLDKAPNIPIGWFTLATVYAKQVRSAININNIALLCSCSENAHMCG